jgi:hypothetical protein
MSKTKACAHAGCKIVPFFGMFGDKAAFCRTHKLPGMEDVKTKRCAQTGCKSLNPAFGLAGGKGTYCSTHKLPGMEDVRNKHCAHAGCKSQPVFDVEGGKGAYCGTHKLPGMEDVKTKRCSYAGCKSLNPVFDVEGGKGTYCGTHKLPGMENVKSKRCAHAGCKSLNPVFDVEGGKGAYCGTHKLPGMEDVKNKRCAHAGCKSQPKFDFECGKGTYCGTHKLQGMKDVKSPKCNKCKLFRVNTRGDSCMTCRTGSEKQQRIELEVRGALDDDAALKNYSSADTVHPCASKEGGRAIRADTSWELAEFVLVLEVDEYEHAHYEVSCEQKRIHELHELAGNPLVLVRYNPHAPLVKLGKRARGDSRNHGWLVSLLKGILDSDGKPPQEEQAIKVRGSDQLRVIYAGYSNARVDELWDFVSEAYDSKSSL